MKHSSLLFILGMIATVCAAQPNRPHPLPVYQPDTVFIYSTKGNIYGFYHYIYNDKALRTEEHYYLLDNEQYKENVRKFYTYDAHGNVLSELQQQQSEGNWVNRTQNLYAYDAQQRRTLNHSRIWNDSLGRWYEQHIFHYTYNEQGLVNTFFREDDDSSYIAQVFYRYTPNGLLAQEQWRFRNDTGWMDLYRVTIRYDSNDRMLDYLEENFNHTHGGPPKLEWEPWLNYIYTYDSIGNKTELFTRVWLCVEEEWINEKHIFYTYDSLQRCTEECFYDWSRGQNAHWTKNSLTTYTYNDQNLPTYIRKQTAYKDSWINNTGTSCSYDKAGRLTEKKVEFWNIQDSCWENNALYNWDFHTHGGLTGESYANWDPQKKTWTGVYRTLHTFNENDDEETVSYDMYDARKGWYPFENTLFALYHDLEDTLGTFHASKIRICYRLIADSIPENSPGFRSNRLLCSPNPSDGKLFIRAEGTEILHCQVFSPDGRLCMECRPLQTEVELSVAHLPAGVYLIRCMTGKGTLNQTLIKR